MTTFKNLIATGILAAMSIVSIASTSLNIVKANNYTDSPYSFSFYSRVLQDIIVIG